MSLTRLLPGYLALVRLGAASTFAAPVVLVGRCLFFLLAANVLRILWNVVTSERVSDSLVAELPSDGMALYVGVTEWILLSVPAVHLRLEDDLRSGGIEGMLLRPLSPLLARLFEATGVVCARLAVLGAAGAAWLLVLGERGVSAPILPLLLVVALLGGVVALQIQALVGLTSFWLRRNLPVYMTVQKLSFLFGGLFAPISLYPDWLKRVSELTPFAAHLYWPASLAIHFSLERFAFTLAAELIWAALLSLVLAVVWRAGLKRLYMRGV